MVDLKTRIEHILADKLEESDSFVTKITVSPNYLIRVFIDGDKGITIGRCSEISKYLERELEENGWVPEKYTLEVSSPGVAEPLVLRRQYPQHVGRQLEVALKDGSTVKGRLVAIADDSIGIEKRLNKKKSKEQAPELVDLKFEEIKTTKVKISFKDEQH